MGKLTDDERRLLDELNAKADADDPDEDFEIEIYDTTNGRGARVPFSKGSDWLRDNFGIGQAPPEAEGDAGKPRGAKAKGEADTPKRAGYFGRQAAGQ